MDEMAEHIVRPMDDYPLEPAQHGSDEEALRASRLFSSGSPRQKLPAPGNRLHLHPQSKRLHFHPSTALALSSLPVEPLGLGERSQGCDSRAIPCLVPRG